VLLPPEAGDLSARLWRRADPLFPPDFARGRLWTEDIGLRNVYWGGGGERSAYAGTTTPNPPAPTEAAAALWPFLDLDSGSKLCSRLGFCRSREFWLQRPEGSLSSARFVVVVPSRPGFGLLVFFDN
jgi:hypothetical protein